MTNIERTSWPFTLSAAEKPSALTVKHVSMTSVYTGASVITSVLRTSNTVLLRGNKRFYLTEYIEVSP